MKSTLLALCLLTPLLSVQAATTPTGSPAPASPPAARDEARHSVFAGDARLSVPLTAGYADQPLAEILDRKSTR